MSDPFTTPRKTRRGSESPAAAPVAAAPVAAPAPEAVAQPASLPQDFVYDTEHPVLPVPFKAQIGEHKLEGVGLSVAAAYVAIEGALDPAWKGHREIIKLQFDFPGFSITLFPEAVLAGSREDGEMTLQFMDPAGDHLPQLRYILNSYIAGDFVSLGGMMSYTGPTKPKAAKAAEGGNSARLRLRSVAVAGLSLCLMLATGAVLLSRLTQSYESRPVFIERTGMDMKATTAGQVGYLNPAAKKGEVVFSINSNTGDVLNFQLPCDCEVSVTEGIFEGSTVLPIDSILSFFEPTRGVSVKTQMSIEGLAKAMSGETAYLDISDGRTVPVRVVLTSATNAAADRGDPFVPVRLVPEDGVLGQEDIGKAARLRLSKSWFGGSFPNPLEKS
jgi:alginate biosynthesis protein Alg44